MFEISVSGWFAAAHQLRFPDGSLEPLHGHNWRVKVICMGETLDEMGVLVDFTKLKPAVDRVLATLHDRHLNELPAFSGRQPSAENVAVHICTALAPCIPPGARIACVEVEESPGCTACYRPAS